MIVYFVHPIYRLNTCKVQYRTTNDIVQNYTISLKLYIILYNLYKCWCHGLVYLFRFPSLVSFVTSCCVLCLFLSTALCSLVLFLLFSLSLCLSLCSCSCSFSLLDFYLFGLQIYFCIARFYFIFAWTFSRLFVIFFVCFLVP